MSGHIVKITIEDTHPPVWHRVVLPEHISFFDLHRIIQTAFGWENAHLHEFSFSQSDLRIGEPGEDSWGDVLDEEEIAVDDYLFSCKWIRYTYDFGDDWRHKIVYEKEEPEYSLRYATVVKAKGDNFMEDSGGAWSWEEEERIPFDLGEVNGRLEKMEFPVTETASEIRELTKIWSDPKKLEKMLWELWEEFENREKPWQALTDAAGKKSRQALPNAIGKKLDQWEDFYEKWKTQPKRESARQEESYEQLVLPGIELPQEPKGRGGKRYLLEKRISSSNEAELLEMLNQTQRDDYCKYLRISDERMDSKQQVSAIAGYLKENPEYYLYVLCREDLEYLRKSLALPF